MCIGATWPSLYCFMRTGSWGPLQVLMFWLQLLPQVIHLCLCPRVSRLLLAPMSSLTFQLTNRLNLRPFRLQKPPEMWTQRSYLSKFSSKKETGTYLIVWHSLLPQISNQREHNFPLAITNVKLSLMVSGETC